VAILIVLGIKLEKEFGITKLPPSLSLLFFAWFIGVFMWLATRTLPNGRNLLKDIAATASHAIKKFVRSFIPNSK
jgi:hypothetical protein